MFLVFILHNSTASLRVLVYPLQMGRTALFLACRRGHVEVVSLLVNAQASFIIPDKVYNFCTNLLDCSESTGLKTLSHGLIYGGFWWFSPRFA